VVRSLATTTAGAVKRDHFGGRDIGEGERTNREQAGGLGAPTLGDEDLGMRVKMNASRVSG